MGDELIGVGNIMAVLFRLATSLQVAGSILNVFIGNFHWRIPSGLTLYLLWCQSVTEMSKRNTSWSKCGRFVGLTNLPPSCADCLEIWEPETPGTLSACNWIALTFIAFGNTVLTFSWTDWLRKSSYTSAGMDRYRPTVIRSSCGVEVRLVIAWAGEEVYSFQDGV